MNAIPFHFVILLCFFFFEQVMQQGISCEKNLEKITAKQEVFS